MSESSQALQITTGGLLRICSSNKANECTNKKESEVAVETGAVKGV